MLTSSSCRPVQNANILISLGASGKNVCNCRCTVLYFIHEPGKEVKQPPKIEIDEDLLPESTKYVKVRTNNIRVIDDYRSNENDYNIAEKGGRHHGELETFKKEGEYQINKAIRHFKETIDLHKEWINNPLIKYPDWNTFSKEDKKIKLTKWVKDIERNTEQMHIAKSYYVRIKKWQK